MLFKAQNMAALQWVNVATHSVIGNKQFRLAGITMHWSSHYTALIWPDDNNPSPLFYDGKSEPLKVKQSFLTTGRQLSMVVFTRVSPLILVDT